MHQKQHAIPLQAPHNPVLQHQTSNAPPAAGMLDKKGTIGLRINRASYRENPYKTVKNLKNGDIDDSFNNFINENNDGDLFQVMHCENVEAWHKREQEQKEIEANSTGKPADQAPRQLSPQALQQIQLKEDEVSRLTNLLVKRMTTMPLPPNAHGFCGKCERPVMYSDSGCSAMSQVFHVNCFTCDKCRKSLKGGSFYSVDGKALCEEDYYNTLDKCASCTRPITDRILRATGKTYHGNCFCCVVCGHVLDGIPFTVDANNQVHCIEDFHKRYSPKCSKCDQPIMPSDGEEETVRIVCMNKNFCTKCYVCEDCRNPLSGDDEQTACYPLEVEGRTYLLCKRCNTKRVYAITKNL